jgi:hypothetical protein
MELLFLIKLLMNGIIGYALGEMFQQGETIQKSFAIVGFILFFISLFL